MSGIASIIIQIATVLSAVGVITGIVIKIINSSLNGIKDSISGMDIRECRMFLIGFLCDLERGEKMDEVQWNLAHEIYDHYTDDLKQNSYIHDKWNRVMKDLNKEGEIK